MTADEKGNEALAERMLRAGSAVNLAWLERVTPVMAVTPVMPVMAASYGGHAAGQGHAAVLDVRLASGVAVNAA